MPQVINAEETRKTYFGEKAELYDAKNENTDKRRRERYALYEFLNDCKGTVLDIPIGTGAFLCVYRELGLDFIGMDVSDEMMAQAITKDMAISPEKKWGRICYGDILDIRLADQSVDAAVCIRLLALIDQASMVEAVREMGRVARDRIICSLYTGPTQERFSRHLVHLESEFAEAAASRGFRETAHRFVNDRGYRVALLERA